MRKVFSFIHVFIELLELHNLYVIIKRKKISKNKMNFNLIISCDLKLIVQFVFKVL